MSAISPSKSINIVSAEHFVRQILESGEQATGGSRGGVPGARPP